MPGQRSAASGTPSSFLVGDGFDVVRRSQQVEAAEPVGEHRSRLVDRDPVAEGQAVFRDQIREAQQPLFRGPVERDGGVDVAEDDPVVVDSPGGCSDELRFGTDVDHAALDRPVEDAGVAAGLLLPETGHLADVVDVRGRRGRPTERAEVDHAGVGRPRERTPLAVGGVRSADDLSAVADAERGGARASERAEIDHALRRRPEKCPRVAVGVVRLTGDLSGVVDRGGARVVAPERAQIDHAAGRRPEKRPLSPVGVRGPTDDLPRLVQVSGKRGITAE